MADELPPHSDETVLDLARGTLHRGGRLVMLRPKTLEILAFLACRPGRVVSKEELLKAVWPRLAVTGNSLTQGIRDARRSLADESAAIIRTVPRRGYLFHFPERGFRLVRDEPARPAACPSVRHEPTVAVLPFRLAADVEERRGVFDETAADIAAALRRFETFVVLETTTASALASTPPPGMQPALAQAGVDYLVEGAVERARDLYAVVVTLSDVRSGRRLWAQGFSLPAMEVLDFRESAAMQLASVLAFNVESDMAGRGPPEDSRGQALALTMRGMMLIRSFGEDGYGQAREFLAGAVALDPASGLALSYLALTEAVRRGSYGTRPSDCLDRALEMAQEAATLSPAQARCHRVLAIILLLRREFRLAEACYRQALELNPYDADTIAQMGWLAAMRGDPASGLELVDRGIRSNPVHPPWYYLDRGVILLLLGRHDEAAEVFARMPPRDVNRWALLSLCHALRHDLPATAASLRRARELEPDLTTDMIRHVIVLEREVDDRWLRAVLARAGWAGPLPP
ncbi:hypothetical protein LMIY3S_04959 [Labrys miyagiensis]